MLLFFDNFTCEKDFHVMCYTIVFIDYRLSVQASNVDMYLRKIATMT